MTKILLVVISSAANLIQVTTILIHPTANYLFWHEINFSDSKLIFVAANLMQIAANILAANIFRMAAKLIRIPANLIQKAEKFLAAKIFRWAAKLIQIAPNLFQTHQIFSGKEWFRM